jgi:hypothetical protein
LNTIPEISGIITENSTVTTRSWKGTSTVLWIIFPKTLRVSGIKTKDN